MMEVLHSPPLVTACGFFQVDLHIIPVVRHPLSSLSKNLSQCARCVVYLFDEF